MDQADLQLLGTLHPEVKARICRVYTAMEEQFRMKMRPTSCLRSMSEQKAVWQIGRDEDGTIIDPASVVTYARSGSSWHQYGLAVDSAFRGPDPFLDKNKDKDNIWEKFGQIAESYGLEFGGRFKNPDRPHCQLRLGLNIKQVQDIYKIGGLGGVWNKVDSIINNV